ncbi:MAG: hemerythrin domain-containing protein [Candidatus Sedimenticola sp. (ex Thyasira tokunagai)]
MHKLLEKLKSDHLNMEKILQLLSLQLDHFYAGRESDFDLKIELLEYLEAYASQEHHPLEDQIFEAAEVRLGKKHELFERLRSQHHALDQLTRKFRYSLENILHDGVMLRDELETQGREFIALQQQHLKLEEQEAFPLLDEVMTDKDWERTVSHIRPHDDPVFEAPDRVRFQILVDYLEQSET